MKNIILAGGSKNLGNFIFKELSQEFNMINLSRSNLTFNKINGSHYKCDLINENNTLNTLKPDFNWASSDIGEIKSFYKLDKYILLFPFCSPHLSIKKWPYYNKLIELILDKYGENYKIITAPGPSELGDAQNINATAILDPIIMTDINDNISFSLAKIISSLFLTSSKK